MIAALDANPAAWFDVLRLQPGARVGERSVTTGVPFPLCNSVFFPPDDGALVQDVPQLWWLGVAPDPVRAALRARGVVTAEDAMPGMALDDLAGVREVPAHGMEVEVVRDAAALDDFAEVFAPAYGLTLDARTSVIRAFAAYGLGGDVVHVVGRTRGGRPVACASVIVRDGVCGLYDVATAVDVRRHGYGAAITVAALRAGRAAGARTAILHASELGQGIYERLGFREVAPCWVVETGGGTAGRTGF